VPAKWQRWMPFEIDAFKGSPAVQAMHPAARCGYLYLLADAWQTDDCTVPNDPIDLADKSGLGDELWAIHGPRILRKFEPVEGTTNLRNAAEFERWQDARNVYEKRQASAERTNSLRSPSGKDTVTVRRPSRSAHTRTETETSTETKEKQKPSGDKRRDATKTALAETRHAAFKAAIKAYWDSVNIGVEMPWDGAEGKQLGMYLRSSPNVTVEQFTGFLRHRFKSEVTHSQRPSRWISYVTNYANGPIDRFSQPLTGGISRGTKPTDREANIAAANAQAAQLRRDRAESSRRVPG